MSAAQATPSYKLVLLGDSSVGKSSTIERYIKNEFFNFQQPTIGASFYSQYIKLSDGSTIKFEIWDTAGQDRYRTLAPMYYRQAIAAIVLYDITEYESFLGAKSYVNELRERTEGCNIALVGNKIDLSDKRYVWPIEAKKYADDNDLYFFECSAKTGENIADIFQELAEKIPKSQVSAPPELAISIDDNNKQQKEGCCK